MRYRKVGFRVSSKGLLMHLETAYGKKNEDARTRKRGGKESTVEYLKTISAEGGRLAGYSCKT